MKPPGFEPGQVRGGLQVILTAEHYIHSATRAARFYYKRNPPIHILPTNNFSANSRFVGTVDDLVMREHLLEILQFLES